MFFIGFVLAITALALFIKIYIKLTSGICKCSKHLVGKVVIVTGANTGIGYETAKDLADRGARVILACRNEGRGTTARDNIVAETGNEDVHFRHLDLASLASVRVFAENVIESEKRLDVLVNNAGILRVDNMKTEDGLYIGMQINHFGPFLLTSILLPLLKSSAPSRIINVSSIAYRNSKIDLQNLNMEKETPATYSSPRAYASAKLCNIMMTIELSRRLEGTGVTVNTLHPGVVDTDILDTVAPGWLDYLLPLARLFIKSRWEGAQTSIHLAVAPELEKVSGCYFADCRIQNTIAKAPDIHLASKLWEVSEELIKLK